MYGGHVTYGYYFDRDNPDKLHKNLKDLFESRGQVRPPNGTKLPDWVILIHARNAEVARKKLKSVLKQR